MTFANVTAAQLRKTRLLLKMTQKEFAEATGSSIGIVAGWECGRNKPSLYHLSRVAELMVKASAIDRQYKAKANELYNTAIANGASEKDAKAMKFALYDKMIGKE